MSAQDRRTPNLFIVGAPKCGTTSLYEFLRGHREVFMSPVKEPHVLCTDFVPRRTPRPDLDEYLGFFAAAGDARYRGEASTHYLHSAAAAGEIHRLSPDARAVVMLRDPIEMIRAMHAHYLFNGMEDLADLADALAAEDARRRNERVPAGANYAEMLQYRETAHFADQLDRLWAAVGRERVHVMLLDDLRTDSAAAYRAVLGFLGVDAANLPEARVANRAKAARSRRIRNLIASPPTAVRGVARRVLPRPTRKWLYRTAIRLNARRAPRPPLDPDLRRELAAELRPQVDRLEAMLGRALPGWARAEGAE